MKKRFFAVVLCVSFILALTGCGSRPNTSATQKPSVTPAMTQESTTQDSGEESINSETTEPTTNQSNATGVAVDPAPYWQGDDYFDMVGYLEACGCKVMCTNFNNGDLTTSNDYSSNTIAYTVRFEETASDSDGSAALMLCLTNNDFCSGVNTLAVSYYDGSNSYHRDFTPLPIMDNQRDITVDQYNNTLDIHTITQIEMLVNKLYTTHWYGQSSEDMATFFEDYNQN